MRNQSKMNQYTQSNMKNFLLLIVISLLYSCNTANPSILEQTIEKLESIETVAYDMKVEFLPKEKERNNNIFKANCFYDFRSNDTLLGAKYHFVSNNLDEQVFDGQIYFSSSTEDERVLFEKEPKKHQVNSPIYSLRSLVEVKNVLPELLRDSTIIRVQKEDTIINTIDCYSFNFIIPNRYVSENGLKKVSQDKKNYITSYDLVISKEGKLPVFIRTKNSAYKQVINASLHNFRIGATRDLSTWSYNRFPERYLVLEEGEYYKRKRIKVENIIGQKAPSFTLPSIAGDTISLSKLTNKLTLLEFWFPNCVGCTEAAPHINEMQKKYQEKGLRVYGIEFTRSDVNMLKEYIKKEQIKIPTLYSGDNTASLYSVYGAPTMFLINEKQEVIYANFGFEKEELIALIEKNI